MRCQLTPIAMPPDTRKIFEIGSAIFGITRIIPERHRHGGKRGAAHQLAFAIRLRSALLIPDLDFHSQAQALDFATPDRQDGIAQHKTTANIGATGHRAQQHILFYRRIHVIETLRQ